MRPVSGKTFLYETLIRESHLDSFGHVNHAKYLTLFQEARWEFITQNGYGLEAVLATGQGPVILDAKVRFRKELRLREKIRIESRVTACRGRLSTIKQWLYNADGELCSEIELTSGFFDTQTRKLTKPSPQWLRAIGYEATLSNA